MTAEDAARTPFKTRDGGPLGARVERCALTPATLSKEDLRRLSTDTLALRWQIHEDVKARDLVCERFLEFTQAGASQRPWIERDDAEQQGMLAVLASMQDYDPTRGAGLATLVRYKTMEAFAPLGRQNSLSGVDGSILKAFHAHCRDGLDADASVRRVAERFGKSEDLVRRNIAADRRHAPLGGLGDGEEGGSAAEYDPALIDHSAPDGARLAERLDLRRLRKAVREALGQRQGRLDARDVQVLRDWMEGMSGPASCGTAHAAAAQRRRALQRLQEVLGPRLCGGWVEEQPQPRRRAKRSGRGGEETKGGHDDARRE